MDQNPKVAWTSETARRIRLEHIPAWWATFLRKNADYGDTADDSGLGEAGQYAEIQRKMGKLKRVMWDGQGMQEEQPVEIMQDMIGHLFIAIDWYQRDHE